MADDMEAVTQRFEADVDEYVTEVQAAADEAKRFADAALEAKAGADELRNGAAEAAPEIGHMRDEALEASAAMHELRDAEVEAGAAGADAGAGGISMMVVGIIALVGAIAAVAPALLAVGAGFGAFALFALPALKSVSTAYTQINADHQAYNRALTASARNTALAHLKADYAALSPAQRAAVEGIQQLVGEYHKLSAAFAPEAFSLFNQALKIAADLLPKLVPLAQAGGRALGDLMGSLGKGLDSKGFSDFLQMLTRMVVPAALALARLAGTLTGILGSALTQLAPMSVPFIQMLTGLLKAAGPALVGALKLIAQTVMDIGKAITPVLGPLGKFFGYLSDHPVFAQIIAGIIGIAVAVKVFQGVMSAVSLLSNPWLLLAVAVAAVAILIATHTHQISEAFDVVRHAAAELAHDVAAHFDEIRHDAAQWAGDVRSDVDKVISFFVRLPREILAAVSGFESLLVNAGKAVVEGLIHGIEGMAGGAIGAVVHLGGDIKSAFMGAIHALSPSKDFADIGGMITAGLTLGINSTRQQAIDESRFLAEQVADAYMYGDITKSQEDSLRKKLAAALTAALKGGVQDAFGSGTIKQIGESAQKLLQTIWDTEKGGFIGRTQASQFAGWVKADNATLQSLAVQRNAIAKEIAAAQALARNTASAAESTYNLSSASTTAAGGQAKPGGIIANLKADVSKIRNFAWALRKLAKEGLNKAYLSQLISLGPDAGGAIAGELAGAGLGDIKSINAAESAITYESNQLGANAVSAMYTAGKESGAGFLQGLKDQKKAIETLMSQIAAGVIAALRKDLGIASPSRVMYGHGVDTLQGYINGVKSMQPQLQALMRSIGGGVALGGVGGVAAGGGSGYGGSGQVHVTVPLTAIFGAGSGSLATDPRFMQFIQAAVQEAVARWSLNNPGTGFGLPGRA